MTALSRPLGLLLAGLIAVWVTLTAAGLFDPRPLGRPQPPIGPLTLPAAAQPTLHWLDSSSAPFSVRAAFAPAEATYALVLADAETTWYVGIDRFGYVSIWQILADDRQVRQPWQSWLHLTAGAATEIWLDVTDQGVALRLNRERFPFDAGEQPLRCRPCRIGIWSDGASAVQLQHLTRFD